MKHETKIMISERLRYLEVKQDDYVRMARKFPELYSGGLEKAEVAKFEQDFLKSIMDSEGIEMGSFFSIEPVEENERAC